MRFAILALCVFAIGCQRPPDRPNILWITCEDTGPQIGAYGDTYSTTPNLDSLAARGRIYSHAWSNAPVCAPARTTIISGAYPTSLGAQHMRSITRMPDGMMMYPQYLREAGYYCTNNSKEDYNLEKPGQVWDESSNKAHWRNRKPGQPFFAIFNFTTTHESQIRRRPHAAVHDPAKVRIPAYHPDTPESRQDWAQYYDKITEMDAQAGEILKQLAEDGLAEETIVFFYGDHGAGMPRSKRWPYNSGLHVPVIVHFPDSLRRLAPKDWRTGGRSGEKIAFVDLAPTVLSLAGIQPPAHMQGRAFLGRYAAPEPEFLFGFRDRMDERYDLVRSVRDRRFVYLRQFMPHRIYGQHVAYMFETPTTQVWKRLYDEGKLGPPQTHFWEPKPPEELYDLEADPDETRNLASAPEHQATLERLRGALRRWILETRDTGFLPENEIHSRSEGSTPWEMAHNDRLYPLEKILATAELASSLREDAAADLVRALSDPDSAVRYWGALGLLIRGEKTVRANVGPVRKALEDPAPAVRTVAGEALGRFGSDADASRALETLLELADSSRNGPYVATMAANAIDYCGARARPYRDRLAKLPTGDPAAPERARGYAGRVLKTILGKL
jgi:uncharacterized sulfatase